MSWHDRNHPWRRRAHRAYLGWLAAGWIFLVIGIAFAGVWIWVDRAAWATRPINAPIEWISFTIPLVMLVLFSLISWAMFSLARRSTFMIKTVPLHNGGVCPFCRRVMKPTESATTLRCNRCKTQHDLETLQRFWVWSVLDSRAASFWWVEHHPRRTSLLGRWRRCLMQDNAKRWYITSGFSVVLMFLYLIAGWWWMGTASLGILIPMAMMLSAFSVFPSLTASKVGHARYCAQCSYQAAPLDGLHQQRCPECGLDWASPGGLVVGERRPLDSSQKYRIAVAVGLLVIATASFAVLPSFVHRAVPTSMLMNQVTTGRGFLYKDWNALADRQLSEQQRIDLARGLLQRREERATLEREATQWFLDQHAADALPSDIIDAFYQGIIKTRLLVPEQVTVGEAFTAGIENINRYQNPLASAVVPAVYFVGFSVGPESNACCRAEKSMSLISFGSRVHSYGDPAGIEGAGPRMGYTANEPGPIVVRARFWLAMTPPGPGASIQPIQWDESTKPVFPPGMTWSQEFVLEETVQVVEQAPATVQQDEQHEPG